MTRLFVDEQVFKEKYTPEKLLHRDAAIGKIQHIIGGFRSHILCIGDLGTGKTVALRHVTSEENLPPGVKAVFVNCSDENTEIRVIRAVLEQLGVTVKTGFAGDYYLRLFKAALPPKLILVLDEVDKLIEHRASEYVELFYTLTRTVTESEVLIVMLTNKFTFEHFLLHELEPRVRDTLPFERVEFPDYNALELNDIITARAQIGLKPGSWNPGVMAQMARVVYEHGLRARGLIKLGRKAVELAESQDHGAITEDDVRLASVELLHGQGLEVISRLPPKLRAVLGIIVAKSPTIEEAYESFKKHPLGQGESKGVFYGYIKELEVFGVIEKTKISHGYGKGVTVSLKVPSELTSLVINSLQEDASSNITYTPSPSATNELQLTYTLNQKNNIKMNENEH